MFVVPLLVLLGTLLQLAATEKSAPVDVLARLKNNVPDCDLKRFVLADNDLKVLNEDLAHYCSAVPKDLTKYSKILCRMVYYELRKACDLTEGNRTSPAKYDQTFTVDEICKVKNVLLTTDWIWKKLKLPEENEWDLTETNFCPTLAAANETRRLIRFFYKIAPRVRQADPVQTAKVTETQPETPVKEKPLAETGKAIADKGKDLAEMGKATAEKVEEKSKDLAETGKATADKAVEKGKDLIETGKAAAEKFGEKGKDLAEKGKAAVEQVGEKVKQVAELAKDKVSQTAELVKPAVGGTSEKSSPIADAPKEAAEGDKAAVKVNPGATTRKWDAGPAVQPGKDNGNQSNETSKANETIAAGKGAVAQVIDLAKDKATQTVEIIKDKATDAKNAVATTINKTVEVIKTGAETVVEKGKEVLSTAKNVTGEVQKSVNPTVLDLNEKKAAPVEKKKNDEDEEEEEADDDQGDNVPKKKEQGNEQGGQIPKPDLDNESQVEKKPSVPEVPPVVTKSPSVVAPTEEEETETADETEGKGNKEKPAIAAPPVREDPEDYDGGNAPRGGPNSDDAEDENKPISAEKENNKKNNNRPEEPKRPAERIPEKSSKEKANRRPNYPEDEGWSGNFVTYFLLLTLFIVVGYLVLHNKNKLVGYFVEGRRTGSSRTGSRPSHRHYEQIKNVNDVIDLDLNTNTETFVKN